MADFNQWAAKIRAEIFDRRIRELLATSRACDERALKALGDGK